MRDTFDRRVVPDDALDLVRACQERAPCLLAGGAVLSGAWLVHRLSRDLDVFVRDREEHRSLVRLLPEIANNTGVEIRILRDAGTFVRAEAVLAGGSMDLDIVLDPLPDLEPPTEIEAVRVASEADLRASKLACILSRSEPRDLVDVWFIERAGHRVEDDLAIAARKDGGIDPGVLAWLLSQFPLKPLPTMLIPITEPELRTYRDELADRLRRLAVPAT